MFDVPIEKFVVRNGKNVLCQPALVLALFTPRLEGSENLSGPLSAFVRRFGDALEWYQDEPQQAGSKRVPQAGREEFFAGLVRQSERVGREDWAIELRAQSERSDWAPPAFELQKNAAPEAEMSLWMALPIQWLESQGVKGLDLLLDEIAASGYPFSHGYAGLGLVCNHRAALPAALKALLRDWAKQHPGLMAIQPTGQAFVASWGLVDVGWVTVIAASEAQKIGGKDGVIARVDEKFSAKIVIHELPGGAYAIRAGESPEFGDLNLGRRPECQTAVGRALRPLWDAEKNARVVLTAFETTGDFTEQGQWANRFFVDA